MNHNDAFHLIKNANINTTKPTKWADLGCGSGVFTDALAKLLFDKSHIFAIDRSLQSFQPPSNNKITTEFIQADFETDELPVSNLYGILMANSLHFIKNKKALLHKLQQYFSGKGIFIIVEYDILKANPWIPFPITFRKLQKLFFEAGYEKVNKIGERPSIYGHGKMYAASIC